MPVVLLVRHGQASFGAADYDVLSDIGHRQATLLAGALRQRGVRPDRVVTGLLRRQRETAESCAGAAAWAVLPDIDPRWDEYDHVGLLRGQAATTGPVQAMLDAALLEWISSGRPGADGRSFTQWRDDAVAARRDLMESLGSGGTGLAFTSGGVLAAICADLLGLGTEGFLALNRVVVNTGITKIVGGRQGTSLISFNDHGHLEGAADLVTYR